MVYSVGGCIKYIVMCVEVVTVSCVMGFTTSLPSTSRGLWNLTMVTSLHWLALCIDWLVVRCDWLVVCCDWFVERDSQTNTTIFETQKQELDEGISPPLQQSQTQPPSGSFVKRPIHADTHNTQSTASTTPTPASLLAVWRCCCVQRTK